MIVNYLYKKLFENHPNFPNFSIFRLMMIIWFREVICQLNSYNSYSICSSNNEVCKNCKDDVVYKDNLDIKEDNMKEYIVIQEQNIKLEEINIKKYKKFNYKLNKSSSQNYYLVDRIIKLFNKFLSIDLDNYLNNYSKDLTVTHDIKDTKDYSKDFIIKDLNKDFSKDLKTSQNSQDNKGLINEKQFNTITNSNTSKLEIDRFYSMESNASTVGSINHENIHIISNKALDDIKTFEFQSKYYIENISMMLLDIGCNEYSTFFINSTNVILSITLSIILINLLDESNRGI